MSAKRLPKVLYDIADEHSLGGLRLVKFKRMAPPSHYISERTGELIHPQMIFTTFKPAQEAVLKKLRAKRDRLQTRIEEIEIMTASDVPFADDPYC